LPSAIHRFNKSGIIAGIGQLRAKSLLVEMCISASKLI
jgi:hypothetical protein